MSHPLKVYLAGPMTGLPDFNMPAFDAAADRLRQRGWNVINPAEHFDGRTDLPRDMYLRADLGELVRCNAIALLPGWQESQGARMEYFVARELGIPALDAQTGDPIEDAPVAELTLLDVTTYGNARRRAHGDTPLPQGWTLTQMKEGKTLESILDEAKRITAADRQNDYGPPSEDFAKTALMWTAILRDRLCEGAEITAADVPLCMIAVKLARQAHRHKRDNLVDIAGYAQTAAMVVGGEA
ncbi:MAG: DUF4406 domain-containing protein [Sedimentisphaerales bacterium]|nr:DUF4406 domain-containing protein [Sedimentisphaerales bacterium]